MTSQCKSSLAFLYTPSQSPSQKYTGLWPPCVTPTLSAARAMMEEGRGTYVIGKREKCDSCALANRAIIRMRGNWGPLQNYLPLIATGKLSFSLTHPSDRHLSI
jgi:hypothetical protein